MARYRLFLAGTLAFALACAGGPSSPPTRADVEKAIRLPLPADASAFQVSVVNGLDTLVHARFETADGTAWAVGQGMSPKPSGPGHYVPTGPDWWAPAPGPDAIIDNHNGPSAGWYVNIEDGENLDVVWVQFVDA